MFIDSPAKFKCGSSGAECCYRRHTSRSAGARPEGVAATINIWSLWDQAYSSHTLLLHYLPKTDDSMNGIQQTIGTAKVDHAFINHW